MIGPDKQQVIAVVESTCRAPIVVGTGSVRAGRTLRPVQANHTCPARRKAHRRRKRPGESGHRTTGTVGAGQDKKACRRMKSHQRGRRAGGFAGGARDAPCHGRDQAISRWRR